MDLPVFRKGLELVSSQLNKLSNGIRAAQITSVIGGSFTRTPAGTTLIIDQQPSGGGGAALPCPFEATNASTETQQRVEIKQGTITTNNPSAPNVWPNGMGIGFPPFYLDVTGNGYVYLGVTFDVTTYFVSADAGSVFFEFSETLKANTASIQYILTSTITVTDNVISNIENVCSQPVVNPCLLQLETLPPV